MTSVPLFFAALSMSAYLEGLLSKDTEDCTSYFVATVLGVFGIIWTFIAFVEFKGY